MNFFLIIFLFGLSPPGISKKFSSLIGFPETIILSSHNEDVNKSTEDDNSDINDSANFDVTEGYDVAPLQLTVEKTFNFSAESYGILKDSMHNLQDYLKNLSRETPEEEIQHPKVHDYNDLEPNELPDFIHLDILTEEERNRDPEKGQYRNHLNKVLEELPMPPKIKKVEMDEEAVNNENESTVPISDIPYETISQSLQREDVKLKIMLTISLLTFIIFLIFTCICCFIFSQAPKKRPKKNLTIRPELATMSYFQPAEGVSETSFSKSTLSSTLWGPGCPDFKNGMNVSEATGTVQFLHKMDEECMKSLRGSKELELSSTEPHSMEKSGDEMSSQELNSWELPGTEAESSGK
uniref:Equatorin isoform X2 n=1 Tax=Phascolarctos cinereus TaxID=38626 RepID=A0A6P5J412_PHACI|nr:equatorin isoform X2 [Phascolarctos cinereus]